MDPVTMVRRLVLVASLCGLVAAGGAVAAQPDTQVAFKPADSSRERAVPYAVPSGSRALVAFLTPTASYAVIDLVSGRVLRTEKRAAPPFVLLD